MTKFDYYRAVVLGAVVGMSFLTLFYMVNVAVDVKEPQELKSTVEVVGKYKECDILQYSNEHLGRYQYMLYCGKEK